MCNLVVVWKARGKLGALFLAERSEIGVADGVVGFVEVVVALGVADAVDCCFAHVCYFVGYGYMGCRFEVCRCWRSYSVIMEG